MIREFITDIGRFKKGQRFDYPLSVWSRLADEAGLELDELAKNIEVGKQTTFEGRIFTKDAGRWRKGQNASYPAETWDRIAKEIGAKLDTFTTLEN